MKQCQQLWYDIERLTKNESLASHFMGSVVYIEKGLYQVTMVPQLLVIDGQQRLTTVSLMLAALGRILEERQIRTEISKKKIEDYYLFNSQESGEKYHKLILTSKDKDSLNRLLEDHPETNGSGSLLEENFNFFEKKIRESGIAAIKIFQAINKLTIVDVALDRNYDNPQLIFESLNSTGLALSQADLIRNYVLMRLEPQDQTRIYETYWHPVELLLDSQVSSDLFDRFMRDYLTIKTGRIPNINEVYQYFKRYAQELKDGGGEQEGVLAHTESLAKDIKRYSYHFSTLVNPSTTNPAINDAIRELNILKVDVVYPFLMAVLDDMRLNIVSETEVSEIIQLINSYIFRRAICSIPTNSLNKIFAGLSKEIRKDAYLESFKAALLLSNDYRRFPKDEEFKNALLVRDVYTSFRLRNYMLGKLENHDRKEPVSIEDYTIEHILPQNKDLSEEWQKELGENWKEVQDQYLHTIGNLTLTRYNPELSDKSFNEKRSMAGGFKDSPIRLNRTVAMMNRWTQTEIISRGKQIADLSIKIWQYPVLPDVVLEKYRKSVDNGETKKWTLKDHSEYLNGPLLDIFDRLNNRIRNLDSSVRMDVTKHYIAFKAPSDFVDIQPQKQRLLLWLNIPEDVLNDPERSCSSFEGKGHWGNGNLRFELSTADRLDYLMSLIRQAFEFQNQNVIDS